MGFLTKKNQENILIIDITSGSVGVALVHSDPDDFPTITVSSRTPFVLEEKPTNDDLQDAMILALRESLTHIARTKIDKALVFLSSPWLMSHLKSAEIDEPKGVLLNDAYITQIMKDEENAFRYELKNKYKEASDIFESSLTDLHLNGYEAELPISQKVSKARISFILSAAPRRVIKRVEDELIKAVAIEKGVLFSSFMYAYFKVLSSSFQNLHSALLINMTSELTDILFFKHGSATLNVSLPFGPAKIARIIKKNLDIPMALAYSYISLFASGNLNPATTAELEEAFKDVEAEWTKLWGTMRQGIPDKSEFPYSIFLIAPTPYSKLCKTLFEDVLPAGNIILVGEGDGFTKEISKVASGVKRDDKLSVLTAFSKLLI